MAREHGERLRRYWAKENAVREGASEAAISALERDLRIVLPADFRDYLAVVDGMNAGQWVGSTIDLWPVDRIREEASDWGCFEPGAEGTLLPFADFLINSHAYAIRVSSAEAPVFIVWNVAAPWVQCASSFEEFVSRYQDDHPALYGRG